MYGFIATYLNMEVDKHEHIKIDIDCTPLDSETMGCNELVFAWKEAAIKAASKETLTYCLETLELLYS